MLVIVEICKYSKCLGQWIALPFNSMPLTLPNVVIDSTAKGIKISTGFDFWMSKFQCIGSTKAIATKVCMFLTFAAKRHQDPGSKRIKVNVCFKLIYKLSIYWDHQNHCEQNSWELTWTTSGRQRENQLEWPGLLIPVNPAPGTLLFPRLYCLILPKLLSQLGIVLKHMTLGGPT